MCTSIGQDQPQPITSMEIDRLTEIYPARPIDNGISRDTQQYPRHVRSAPQYRAAVQRKNFVARNRTNVGDPRISSFINPGVELSGIHILPVGTLRMQQFLGTQLFDGLDDVPARRQGVVDDGDSIPNLLDGQRSVLDGVGVSPP